MGGDSPFPGESLGQPVTFTRSLARPGHGLHLRTAPRRPHGYWVVSPLLVDGTQSRCPSSAAGRRRPARRTHGPAAVTGWLQYGEGSGAVDADPNDDVLPELRIACWCSGRHRPLQRLRDLEAPAADWPASKPDDAPPVSQFTALRNFLYAIEWWVFGLFALAVWVRWCRDTLGAGHRRGGPVPSST